MTARRDEIVRLRDVEKLPWKEIARRLGIHPTYAGEIYRDIEAVRARQKAWRAHNPERARELRQRGYISTQLRLAEKEWTCRCSKGRNATASSASSTPT